MKEWQKVGLLVLVINFAGAVMVLHQVERMLWAAVSEEVLQRATAEIIAEVRSEARLLAMLQGCVSESAGKVYVCNDRFLQRAEGGYKDQVLRAVIEERER